MRKKKLMLSTTPVYIRIQDAAKKLGLDMYTITKEYGINEVTAEMLERKLG